MKDAAVIPTGSAARGTIGSASLDALPVGIYFCDAEGRITRFNRRVAEVWGRTPLPGETERSFCGALFAPDGSPLPRGWTPAADVLRTRQPTRDLQIVIERPDGSRVHVLANLDPLFGENGDFAGAVGCFQDISAVTRTHEELQSSRDDLDDFFENAVIGLHVVANDGIILRANKAELDLLGYARSEYIGRHIAEFHADQAVIEDILQRLQRGEALDRYPARLKAKDGSIRHVLITSNGRFEGNSFAHTRCFTQDVTQEKLAEEQLREGEQRFRNVLEGMPMAIFTTDAEGFITFYNRVASQLAGREPRIGVDRYSIMPKIFTAEGEPLPPERTPIALTLKEKRPIRGVELIGERADGSRIHYVPHPAPLFDACGRIAGGVNVLEDITESHKAKTELAHLAGIVASSNDAIISKTLEGIIRSWNAGAERIFGYSAERSSASRSPPLCRRSFMARRRRSCRGFSAESGSSISRRSASARMAAVSASRSPPPQSSTCTAGSSGRRKSRATSPNAGAPSNSSAS